ncbi:MAG TPA: asparagine synthase (glutamine-hydrolyzing) [Methylophilaceae bacterium]|nr:asparagine synthase (glutamine-hydrolyzing) [Methylophilaceae bacterium]
MCGLAGWFKLDVESARRPSLLQEMCSVINHRGPDDHGIYTDNVVGFGFQRLSIVDLEGGHQPMTSQDERIVITFNGEIFNHVQLRYELINQGVTFLTRSDTEVILKLYETGGIETLSRLNGMFAIAIWDMRQGVLHLVRDRLGVKPLYYAKVGNALLFGSEIKSILASGRLNKSTNHRAIWDYLTLRYIPAPHTIWEHVYKLPPAHRLEYRLGDSEPRISRWWDMPMSLPASQKSDREYEEEFSHLFEDAVRLRLQADVPVGITLSGGLDSSAVVAAAGTRSLHTFSVAFANAPDTDELAYARMVAEKFSTHHHEVIIGEKDFLDFLPEFVWYTDEPMADLASVPLYYVSRLARQNVKVVLSGEGADEIFAGYDFGRWAALWDQVSAARSSMRRAPGLLSLLTSPFSTQSRENRRLAATVTDQRLVAEPISMTNLWSSDEKHEMLLQSETWPDSLDSIRQHVKRIGNQSPLNQVLYSYCQDWLVEDLLMKADRMSMANSLELRTPFLDYRLVEWAAHLPTRLKAGPTESGVYRTKEILRRYASQRLPAAVIERPKQGFPVPVYGWLSGKLASWANDLLLNPSSHLASWIKPEALKDTVKLGTMPTANSYARHRLWNLLILELWMQRWLA